MDTPGRHILVAEDNPVNQKLARLILEQLGHDVDLASDGAQACEALEQGRYDLVFMDVEMPGMDGVEATGRIRERERADGRHTPIVALTAHDRDEDRERVLEAGMDDHVAKPLKPADLMRAIDRFASAAAIEAHATVQTTTEENTPTADADFDPTNVIDMMGGDQDALAEILQVFLDSCAARETELREAHTQRDLDALRRAAHAVVGAAGNFHAGATVRAAKRLEDLCAEGESPDIDHTYRELETAFGRLRQRVEVLRDSLAVTG